jgi:hypothetical protein
MSIKDDLTYSLSVLELGKKNKRVISKCDQIGQLKNKFADYILFRCQLNEKFPDVATLETFCDEQMESFGEFVYAGKTINKNKINILYYFSAKENFIEYLECHPILQEDNEIELEFDRDEDWLTYENYLSKPVPKIEEYSELLRDSVEIWEKNGIDIHDECELLFSFYATSEDSLSPLTSFLNERNFETKAKVKRTLFIFKGHEVLATKKDNWTIPKILKEIIDGSSKCEEIGSVNFEAVVAQSN